MPKKIITNETFDDFPVLEGFDGPFRNQYLKGIAVGKGSKRFETLEEASNAALENVRCGGITVTRQGTYTLRQKTNLYNSDIHNKFKSIEVTYVKKEVTKYESIKPKKVLDDPLEIIEYIPSNKNRELPENIYEIIKFKNEEYYYNPVSRNIIDLHGYEVGKLIKGIIK